MKEGRKPEYPEKTPDDATYHSQKMQASTETGPRTQALEAG